MVESDYIVFMLLLNLTFSFLTVSTMPSQSLIPVIPAEDQYITFFQEGNEMTPGENQFTTSTGHQMSRRQITIPSLGTITFVPLISLLTASVQSLNNRAASTNIKTVASNVLTQQQQG